MIEERCVVDVVVEVFPKFQDFAVVHDYLVTPIQKMQARIDRRGQNGQSGSWSQS